MKLNVVYNLPVNSAGCGDIRLSFDGTSLIAEFEYASGDNDLVGRLVFHGVIAFRFHDELHHEFVEGSYDTLVEVHDSSWCQAIVSNEPPNILRSAVGARHFAVLFSSNGYLELIAKEFVAEEAKTGSLPK